MSLTQAEQSGPVSGPVGDRPAAAIPGLPDETHLARLVRHLVHRALTAPHGDKERLPIDIRSLLHPGSAPDAGQALTLGAEGLGLDSLALIAAATEVSRFFDLGTTGIDDHLLFAQTVGDWAALIVKHFALQGPAAQIIFETSGSTDKPTRVQTPLSELMVEVDALISSVVPDRTARIVALCPPQHIYGFLYTALLPARLDVPVLDAVHSGPGHTLSRLAPGDLVIGTPHNWQTLMDYGGDLPESVSGITSGAAMAADLWDRSVASGLTQMVEVFGATETGGLGWRTAAGMPFTLLPHRVRQDEVIADRDTGAALPLQDLLSWKGPQQFQPAGRVDHAVQVAGVNVSLQKLRQLLCDAAPVADAAVRLDAGQIKAFVVPADPNADEAALIAALGAHLRGKLPSLAHPRAYCFGPALPRNAMGKLQDW